MRKAYKPLCLRSICLPGGGSVHQSLSAAFEVAAYDWHRGAADKRYWLGITRMFPQVPLPTDNFYKFACLAGLALIVTCIAGFIALYAIAVERGTPLMLETSRLEKINPRSTIEDKQLTEKRQLIEFYGEAASPIATGLVIIGTLGVVFLLGGGIFWFAKAQWFDDQIKVLQFVKLALEVAELQKRSESADRPRVAGDG